MPEATGSAYTHPLTVRAAWDSTGCCLLLLALVTLCLPLLSNLYAPLWLLVFAGLLLGEKPRCRVNSEEQVVP
jgi:hypothetical protein